jgi:hypothetical protein
MSIDATELNLELFSARELEAMLRACDRPVVLEMGLVGVTAARLAEPLLLAVVKQFGPRVRCCKVDASQSPEVCDRFGVERVPTLAVFCRGAILGRFTHRDAEDELLACVQRAVASVPSVTLAWQVGRQLLAQDAVTLRFQLHNLHNASWQRVRVTVAAPLLFGEVPPKVVQVGPGETRPFGVGVELRRASRGGFDVELELEGTEEPGGPWRAEGTLELAVERDSEGAVTIGGNVEILTTKEFTIGPGRSDLSTQADRSPKWMPIPLYRCDPPPPPEPPKPEPPASAVPGLAGIAFPPQLADEYQRFLALYDCATLYGGCRPGRIAAGRPHDQWGAVTARGKTERQLHPFPEAPDGIYRLELFERPDGRFSAIAYEKRGNTFVAHWCTNDPDYARRHPEVFGDVA